MERGLIGWGRNVGDMAQGLILGGHRVVTYDSGQYAAARSCGKPLAAPRDRFGGRSVRSLGPRGRTE